MYADYCEGNADSKWNWLKNFRWTQSHFDCQCDDNFQVEDLRNNLPHRIT